MDGGEIRTWSHDKDGDFTHVPEQWNQRAWLRPHAKEEQLVFNIFPPANTAMSKTVYAVYHGRFVEMLLTHFDNMFNRAVASSLPTEGDRVDTT